MAKYIELIDKYRIEQGEGDYNPPSYVWMDNIVEKVLKFYKEERSKT